MYPQSRIAIYEYLYGLFYDVVTKNVYSMGEPQELTQSDTKDGFMVIRVGDIYDASEFDGEAYGVVRCFAEVFVPSMSRGRLDYTKYSEMEHAVNDVIHGASLSPTGTYEIQSDSVLSMDDNELSNSNNQFFVFVKSFIVNLYQ